MTQTHMGWMIGLGALGMMFGLMGTEVAELQSWSEALTPGFIGNMLLHASVVIAAFVGGKLIPTRP